jgi:hypothetical protein
MGEDGAGALDKLSRLLATCRQAGEVYGRSRWSVLARVARLRLVERFSPRESFLWGLADPGLPIGDVAGYASRSLLYRLQARDNPRSLAFLTEDKAFFYGFCAGAGIAVPRLLGVYHPQAGWSARGPALRGRDAWRRFFREETPERGGFVIKPAKGVYARGLRVLERRGDQLFDRRGPVEVDALLDQLDGDGSFDLWVIQERLRNHPELERLSGSQALQTARVVTYVDRERRARVLFACFKVIASDQDSDNFDYGRSGNLVTNVDLERGTLEGAVGASPTGVGLTSHAEHPRTGIALDGFALPHWPALRELVEAAAIKFWPLRTIGWDVAIGADGPTVIEGNVWWDALHNTHRTMPRYLALHGRRPPAGWPALGPSDSAADSM